MVFEINFCDLKEEVQDALLEAVGVEKPEDMNWDRENPIMAPIAYYELPDEEVNKNKQWIANGRKIK